MSLEMQLLTTALTVIVTAVTTALVNRFLSIPKKWKEQRKMESQQILSKIDNLESHLTEKIQQQYEDVKQLKKDVDLLKQGSQATMKNELKLRYQNWLKLRYAPMDAKDDLEKMYAIYHQLGANGVLTELHREFLSLPTEPLSTAHKHLNQ